MLEIRPGCRFVVMVNKDAACGPIVVGQAPDEAIAIARWPTFSLDALTKHHRQVSFRPH
jgi:hypothetical protein